MDAMSTLLVLANVSFQFGLIDASEHGERLEVAGWLCDKHPNDPREPSADKASELSDLDQYADAGLQIGGSGKSDEPDWVELVALRKWYFTRSDPDPYPSTPHGHLRGADRSWPKLNPYTGRVFKAKHQEDLTLRLSKREMQIIWRSEAFRDFCRSHILWYMEAHPYYKFSVLHPLRFPTW